MDQRTTIGASPTLTQPIHRACVVTGCWCGSTTAAATGRADADAARARGAGSLRRTGAPDRAGANLTDIALRSVGLPVV